MAVGMTFLGLQFLLQIIEALTYGPRAAGWANSEGRPRRRSQCTFPQDGHPPMSVAAIGFLYAGATLSAMLAGIPIAFALGFVALAFMFFFMPGASLDTGGAESLRGDGLHHPPVDPALHPEGRSHRS